MLRGRSHRKRESNQAPGQEWQTDATTRWVASAASWYKSVSRKWFAGLSTPEASRTPPCATTRTRALIHQFISAGVLAITAGYATADAKEIFPTAAGDIVVETIAGGLEHPWSFAFLPDGRMLVTERPGRMRIVTREGTLSPPIEGVPVVFTVAGHPPGLFDVAVDLNYTRNQTIYFCYVEPVDGAPACSKQLLRSVTVRLPRFRIGGRCVAMMRGSLEL